VLDVGYYSRIGDAEHRYSQESFVSYEAAHFSGPSWFRLVNSPPRHSHLFATDSTPQRNISDVVNFLKKEMLLTDSTPGDSSIPYRTVLTETLYDCATRFPVVAGNVVRVLLNYIGGVPAVWYASRCQ
jgi:hypothetical protein